MEVNGASYDRMSFHMQQNAVVHRSVVDSFLGVCYLVTALNSLIRRQHYPAACICMKSHRFLDAAETLR